MIGSRPGPGGGSKPPPTVSVEDATSFLIDMIRKSPTVVQKYGYEVYLPNVVDAFANSQTPRPDHFEVAAAAEELSSIFFDAAWQLCRLGVLRPGVFETRGQSTTYGEGYSVTAFGREWLENHEQPAYVPTDVGRIGKLLTRRQDLFGPVYVIRANDAALCYSAHAFYACCVMIGAAAESIVLAAAIAKLTEPAALKLYRATNGRKSLTDKVLANCPTHVDREFRLHVGLIDLWRDQSAHAHAVTLGETEAFTNLRGLIKFAQFAEDRWAHLTAP
jgi:hypothetical protein